MILRLNYGQPVKQLIYITRIFIKHIFGHIINKVGGRPCGVSVG